MTPFDVVLVPFPFTDLSATKKRPCLVLSVVNAPGLPPQYILAMMTSNRTGLSFPGDVELQSWQKAALPKPTLVRLAKVVTVDASLIEKQLGTLAPGDQNSVRVAFQRTFDGLLK